MATSTRQLPAIDARHIHHRHGGQPFTFAPPTSLAAWVARSSFLREHLRDVLGLDQQKASCPLDAQLTPCGRGEGYVVERVWFQSQPGFICTGNLYRPPAPEGAIPGILNPHGHWGRGRLEDGPRGSVRARCIAFARMGMVAFAYDMVGYNDSLQVGEHKDASRRASLWGLSSMALQTRNSLRAVDLMHSLPYVDRARIGCTGASGGGTQTFMLGALDSRVAVLAPVNMVSAHFQGGCTCENAPGMRTDTHNVEIAAMVAPRPLLLVSATGDWTINLPRVEYPAIRHVYALYDAVERVHCVQQDAPHNYNAISRIHVYRWFARWFLGSEDAALEAERSFSRHSDSELRVFPRGRLPEGYQKGPRAIGQLAIMAQKASDARLPRTGDDVAELSRTVRRRLPHILSIDLPKPGDVYLTLEDGSPPSALSGQKVVLGLASRGTRIDGRLWLPAHEQPAFLTLVLHRAGIEGLLNLAQEPTNLLASALDANHAVLAISPLGTPAPPTTARARRDRDWFWSTYNPPILGEQILDVLTGVTALRKRWPNVDTALLGVAGAGAWALMAAALDKDVSAVHAEVGSWAWDDHENYLGDMFAPCLARYGLLPAIAASLAPRYLALSVHSVRGGLAWPRASYDALGTSERLAILPETTAGGLRQFLETVTERRTIDDE